MLLLIAAALAGISGSAATEPAADISAPAEAHKAADTPKRICREPRMMIAREARVAPRRLDDLPPGNLELAVQREVDGCIEPTIIRQDVGGRR